MLALPDWLGEAVCVAICAASAVVDLRSRHIPNVLSLGGVVLGLLLVLVTTPERLGSSLWGAALLGGTFVLFARLGAVGLGDVKLMTAVGVFTGWPLAYGVLVHVLVAGAAIAMGWALWHKQLAGAIDNLAAATRALGSGRAATALHPMPYGLAIFVGTLWSVLGRRFGVPTLL